MTALAKYPELHQRVAALISVAGVVNGSPLADQMKNIYGATLGAIDFDACPIVDGDEVKSITRATRLSWLQNNSLPTEPLYFSLIGTPSPDRVSTAMQPFYNRLAHIDPLNDGQVITYDAVLPKSTLLGFAAADHFAIAIPFESSPSVLSQQLLDRNQYPRTQLLEAAVKMVELSLFTPEPTKVSTAADISKAEK